MKITFLVFSVILLLLASFCINAFADLTLEETKNLLDGATLIPGLNIQKSGMYQVTSTKNAFRTNNKSEFILIKQFESTCGTTSAEMVLHYYGQDVGQQEIWNKGGVHIIEGGSFPAEIREALTRLGVPASWYNNWSTNVNYEHLEKWVAQDRPPIVLLRFDDFLHYMVVVGYNEGYYLLADPNNVFRWMSFGDFKWAWGLHSPPLPNDDYPIENKFRAFGLKIAAFGVTVLTGGNNVIVPRAAPNKHFPPNYNAVTVYSSDGKYIRGGRAVRGGNRFNPTWSTDAWEETFKFTEDIVDYRVSSTIPAEFENLGGFEPAYVQGHRKIDNRTVKVWGRIAPGSVTKGRIFLFVRGYKAPLYGQKTESQVKSHRFSSNWGLDWEYSWQSFTFPGDVVGYTISTDIDWEDRFGAKLVEHHHTGNQVRFRIALRKHKIETNSITVNVTAHYEPPVPGSIVLSSSASLSGIPSGENRTITVKVYSTKGRLMPGVKVYFNDTNDSEIAFSPTSAVTNSSGVATSTMKTGSYGNADFSIVVSGLSKTYNVSVKRKLKEYTVKKWFSSDPVYCKKKVVGVCVSWETGWYTSYKHIDVPSWVSIHSYSITTHVPVEDRATAPYVRSHSRSGNRVKLTLRLKRHYLESNDILVRVHAKYWGSEPSPGAPSKPGMRPDSDTTVAAVWQELSHAPSDTVLLPNYPNPFNPETWIPYRLAEPANVILTIYSADGKLVRNLALGHQPVGIYESKGRAAYWDGRNSVGERVAGGLYFYTLSAGDFAATRKMLIIK